MKKTFAWCLIIVIAFSMFFSCGLLTGCAKPAAENKTEYGAFVSDGVTDLSVGVLADIHVMAESQAVDMSCADFKTYESKGQKMLKLSSSILKTTVDRIINESDLKVVLLSGDNADDGGEVSHREVAKELKRLEDAGIKVFVVPGNHDINNRSYTYAGGTSALTDPTNEAEFAEIYKDFGYSASEVIEFYKNKQGDDPKNDTFAEGDNLSYEIGRASCRERV